MGDRFNSITGEEMRMILLNARRICRADYLRRPWWVLAHDVFGVGSTSGAAFCRRAGINPHDTPALKTASIGVLPDSPS